MIKHYLVKKHFELYFEKCLVAGLVTQCKFSQNIAYCWRQDSLYWFLNTYWYYKLIIRFWSANRCQKMNKEIHFWKQPFLMILTLLTGERGKALVTIIIIFLQFARRVGIATTNIGWVESDRPSKGLAMHGFLSLYFVHSSMIDRIYRNRLIEIMLEFVHDKFCPATFVLEYRWLSPIIILTCFFRAVRKSFLISIVMPSQMMRLKVNNKPKLQRLPGVVLSIIYFFFRKLTSKLLWLHH